MSKIKVLSIVAGLLFLCNVLMIAFFLVTKPKHPIHNNPKEIVIEKLKLDNSQIQEYEVLIEGHSSKVAMLDEEIKSIKNQLFSTLKKNAEVGMRDSLINNIALKQAEIERTHMSHFESLKALCKNDQITYFEKLTEDISKIFAPPGRNNPRPPRDKKSPKK
jgi:hypothetical protein